MQRFGLLGRAGAGANSTVYKCKDGASGAFVAVKKLGCNAEQVIHEAAIMRLCQGHKHCVQLLEAHQGVASGAGYLVMEHVEHSLSREILLNSRGLPTGKIKVVTHQLAQALELLHSKQVIHCDLKPANVLLTASYSIKLCDFGSAVVRGTDSGGGLPFRPCGILGALLDSAMLTAAGPPAVKCMAAASRWYCAPESLLGWDASPASDIWALGCILAELVTGRPLMPGSEEELDQLCCVLATIGRLSEAQERLLQLLPVEHRMRLEAARARGPLLDKHPKLTACPELLQVLRACLHPDPGSRPTAQQLQAMPFFADLRQALQTSEAAQEVDRRAIVAPATGGTPGPAELQRRSSGVMDVDPHDDASPALPAAAGASDASGGASGAAADSMSAAVTPLPSVLGTADAPAPRRFGGVQAEAPLRPAPRPRVSALTATLRGKAFEGDGGYVDLMPQVVQLAARLEAAAQEAALGPIAIAARRASSAAVAIPLSAMPSGELQPAGAGADAVDCGPMDVPMVTDLMPVPLPAAQVHPFTGATAAAVAEHVCATPIAAAVGGCSAANVLPEPELTDAVAPITPSGGATPTEACPAAPATAMITNQEGGARNGGTFVAVAPVPNIPVSSSVGATPLMAASCAEPAMRAAASRASPGPHAAQLRSRAIINRARRHHSAHSGSVPIGFMAPVCPRSSLGSSATLLQQELAAAAGSGGTAVRSPFNPRQPRHATRRSFADLSELDAVGEYSPLACGTPPDGKRRRSLSRQRDLQPSHGSQPSMACFGYGSLAAEVALGSLPEHEPLLEENQPPNTLALAAVGVASSQRMGRSGSGICDGPAIGSPAWRGVSSRAVSVPQPIAGRSACAGAHGADELGLVGSVLGDRSLSVASGNYLRGNLA